MDMGPCRLELISGGGGGWGDPLDRDPEWVLRDVCDDVISVEAARDTYGVVLDVSSTDVNVRQTEDRRSALREARRVELVQ